MERFEYAVLLKPANGGGFVVTCRDLPQLVTQGDDIAEALDEALDEAADALDEATDALDEAADALDEVFAAYILGKLSFPVPTKLRRGEYLVAPPAGTMAKAALYVAMKEADVTNVQLAKKLGIDEKELRRMLDPHYGSKLPRIAQAIKLLGKRLVIGLEVA